MAVGAIISLEVPMPEKTENTVMPINKYLESLREAAGITQKDLASALETTRQKINGIERGTLPITEEVETKWRRAVKRIAWARAVAVGAIPTTASKPDFMQDTDVKLRDRRFKQNGQ